MTNARHKATSSAAGKTSAAPLSGTFRFSNSIAGTGINTAAVKNHLGGDSGLAMTRLPTIMADAAYAILTRDSTECTGNFFIDEDLLREEGVTDFAQYQTDPSIPLENLMPDFFLGDQPPYASANVKEFK